MSNYKLYRKDFALLDSALDDLEEFISWENIEVISHELTLSRFNVYTLSVIYKEK